VSKIFMGVIATLTVILVIVSWRYASAVERLGETEQANRQLESTLESLQVQNQQLVRQQEQATEVSSKHHEKTMNILRQEMQAKLKIARHKSNNLRAALNQSRQENAQVKQGRQLVKAKMNNKDVEDENSSEKCAEVPIAEFYLKQL